MNRREFFSKTIIGLGAALAAGCGVRSMQPRVHPNGSVIKYLTKAYNDAAKQLGYAPKTMIVSEELYKAFESEMIPMTRVSLNSHADAREKVLRFKSITLHKTPLLTDWNYAII